MCVLSLTIEIGAQGAAFAADVSNLLGARLVDLTRLERGMSLAGQSIAGDAWSGLWRPRSVDLINRLSERILTAAADGNVVICGCTPPIVLERIESVSRIYVGAPLASRARVVQEQFAYPDPDVALIEINHDDAASARLVREAFSADWRDGGLYDLVIEATVDGRSRTLGLISDLVHHKRSTNKALRRRMIEQRISNLLRTEMLSDPPHCTPFGSFKL